MKSIEQASDKALVALLALLLVTPLSPAWSAEARHAPLDFAYRVSGTAFAIGLVFDDGRDVYIQPWESAAAAGLRIEDLAHVVQGPYLVVRGLSNRLVLNMEGAGTAGLVIEYVGAPRVETASRPGAELSVDDQQEVPCEASCIAFAAGPSTAQQPEVARSPVAPPVSATVVVSPGLASDGPVWAPTPAVMSIELAEEAASSRQPPGQSLEMDAQGGPATVSTLPSRWSMTSPEPPAPAAVDLALRVSTELSSLPRPPLLLPPPPPPPHLVFLPNTTVQATLRGYLRPYGLDVEFRSVPLLMVEAFAEVAGHDVREVLRRALSRLGLRGEIQGNRLLVVEMAN